MTVVKSTRETHVHKFFFDLNLATCKLKPNNISIHTKMKSCKVFIGWQLLDEIKTVIGTENGDE